jgi:hypothetical protein
MSVPRFQKISDRTLHDRSDMVSMTNVDGNMSDEIGSARGKERDVLTTRFTR